MDRCEFITSLSSSSGKGVEGLILDDYNIIMLLYNLFGDCDNADISCDPQEIKSATITCADVEVAQTMHSRIDGIVLSLYGDKYKVHSNPDIYGKLTIEISLCGSDIEE